MLFQSNLESFNNYMVLKQDDDFLSISLFISWAMNCFFSNAPIKMNAGETSLYSFLFLVNVNAYFKAKTEPEQ